MGDKAVLDLSGCSKGLWLVKVPKYISERWEKAGDSKEIGKIKIGQRFGKPDINFSMKPELANLKLKEDDLGVPTENKLQVLSASDRTLMVFSEELDDFIMLKPELANLKLKEDDLGVPTENKLQVLSASDRTLMVFSEELDEFSEQGEPSKQGLIVEGKITKRLECRPPADDKYMQMKRKHIENAQKPTRMTKLEDRVVKSFKPVSDHVSNVEYDRKKKEEGKKARLDKDKVQDILFNAFEKHQYYAFKDLVSITQQPTPYLKEILKEIGIYNMRAPHKQMWELKPEYRHYTEAEEANSST